MVFGQRLELTFYPVEFMQQCFPKLIYNYVLSQKVPFFLLVFFIISVFLLFYQFFVFFF